MSRVFPTALTLCLLVLSSAEAQRHPSLDIEDRYRSALSGFSAGSIGEAVGMVVALEKESSAVCVRAVELHTAEALARRDPEALVVQAFLRVAVRRARHGAAASAGDTYSFERVSIEGLERLGGRYLEATRRGDSATLVAGLYTRMAYGVAALRSPQRLHASRELLQTAVELAPEHRAALYSLAVVLELLSRPHQSLAYLDRLLTLEPDNPRYRLRRAVVTVKADRLERGEQLLRELTTDGPTWVRDLATQQLARLLAATGRRDGAMTLLRQALRELPSEKLSLQLAALLDPRWGQSQDALAGWLGERRGDSGPSARWSYEGGAAEEINALSKELGSQVVDRLEALANTLSGLPDLEDAHRATLALCR